MSNIISLPDFRNRRRETTRRSEEEALAAEARAAVRQAIGPEHHEKRAIDFSARNAKLDEARKSALDHLKHVPGVAVLVGLASLATTDLTVSSLLIAGVAVLGWCASAIVRDLKGP